MKTPTLPALKPVESMLERYFTRALQMATLPRRRRKTSARRAQARKLVNLDKGRRRYK